MVLTYFVISARCSYFIVLIYLVLIKACITYLLKSHPDCSRLGPTSDDATFSIPFCFGPWFQVGRPTSVHLLLGISLATMFLVVLLVYFLLPICVVAFLAIYFFPFFVCDHTIFCMSCILSIIVHFVFVASLISSFDIRSCHVMRQILLRH